ncbi:hypothetical protein Trydic_g22337 [Trypoxylus dichotomus]
MDTDVKLHYAAAFNEIDNVKELLESGCKIDAENSLGWTPLMMAARNGHFDMVKFLIENKADATRKNAYGSSVLLVSIASGNDKAVTFLLRHLLNGGVSRQSMEVALSPYIIAILFDHDPLMHLLLRHSFNVNAAAPLTGITPIIFAAMKGNLQHYVWLFSNGADALATNANHQSAASIFGAKHLKALPDVEHEHRKQGYEKEVFQKQESYTKETKKQVIVKHETKRRYRQNQLASMQEPPPSCIESCNEACVLPCEQNPNCYFSPHPQFYPLHHAHKSPSLVYLSPQPTFLNFQPPNDHRLRKSSFVMSPLYMTSPSFSPIPQVPYQSPQVFFSPDFDPNNGSPNLISADNSFLNYSFYQPQVFSHFGYSMPSLHLNNMESQPHHSQS